MPRHPGNTRYSNDVIATPSHAPGDLLVADSFRVRAHPRTGAAQVRGLDLHIERFTQSVLQVVDARLSPPASAGKHRDARTRLSAFFAEALPRIAAYGAGFPRFEAREATEQGSPPALELSLRLLPKLHDSIELRTAQRVRLEHPARKGPNLELLLQLNRELGAEALLLDQDGCVLEGATTALVWWSGDSLFTVASANRVPSICEQLVRAAAKREGIPVGRGTLTPQALAEHEIWAVNALHGIRQVTRLDDLHLPAPSAARLTAFRRSLESFWQPVTNPAGTGTGTGPATHTL